jgi:hypothetical protein
LLPKCPTPVAIAPISNPANAAAMPAHFNQPSTWVTNTAPGADPSASGFGICATATPTEHHHTASDTAAPAAILRPVLRVGTDIDMSNPLHTGDDPDGRHPPSGPPPPREGHQSCAPVPMDDVKPLAALSAVLLGVALLPAVLAGGDNPPTAAACAFGGDLAPVLATIRQLESRGDYTAQASGSSASGAYQFLDSTWNHHGSYRRAGDAPPAVQDAKATEHVTGILAAHDSDITAVPVVWYIGHLPTPGSTEWDTIPYPNAGNALTPRQYQTQWMTEYEQHAADAATSPCVGGATTVTADGWALPGPAELIEANPAALDAPHHDYPAWDWMIPSGTPIYVVRAGTVTTTRTWPRNWFDAGCTAIGVNGCDTCGTGVTITDTAGNRYTYCHASTLAVALGQNVAAGQQIMTSGNTGRSSGPHLHLEIRTPDGPRRCPQQLLRSIREHSHGIEPAELSSAGCSYG